ncbi:hypothetical protein QF026_001960 [Streptomyces aurantiacus]|uniref:DUF6766 family protein n=1 Tax=Streptomyces aurantiacus TaxID=47760 RepID=UPI00278E6C6A|nr:DUF6766 family protein [Streptomyces aurantiacus]MDQ0773494.1 hypothetical protein [Streptomyces aurantiacus]
MNAAARSARDTPAKDDGDTASRHGTRRFRRFRRFLRDNGISLGFGIAFLLALAGQAVAGCAEFNNELATDGLAQVGFLDYLASSDFAVDVTENWQSEYLQFFLYIFATVWLLQRGSPESKEMDKAGPESDEEQRMGEHAGPHSPRWAGIGGVRQAVFSRSLGLVMAGLFLLSWLAQSVAGVAAYNEEQLRQLQAPIGWPQYLLSAEFWSRSLQNWQSELLAVASMAILSVYLRQRGSPESKPVGTPHGSTNVEG